MTLRVYEIRRKYHEYNGGAFHVLLHVYTFSHVVENVHFPLS